MHQAEIIVVLFTAVGVLAVLAHKITLPYPIVLVLGGLALSFVPRLPTVNLNPDVVFYFILPALIYPAALFTSWRDFRRNLRPILLLAIGLVLATTLAVAWIAHSIVPALPWAAAFALGAIVSPPDAVAATAIIRRLGVPHRIQVILEGESLVNDATALVALQFAIAALVTGTFSPTYAAGRFVWAAAGGIGIGLLVGLAMRWVQSHLDNPPIQITFSLLTPFVAYLPAERIDYADYALTSEFAEGLTQLRDLGHKQRSAIMCAEAVWWRCHRRIIADYLICAGESVFHILGPGRLDQAVLTPGAVVQPDGTISYSLAER